MVKKLEATRQLADVQYFMENPKEIADLLKQALEDPNFDINDKHTRKLSALVQLAESYQSHKDSEKREEQEVIDILLRRHETAIKAKLADFNGTIKDLQRLLLEYCSENGLKFFPDTYEEQTVVGHDEPLCPICIVELKGTKYAAVWGKVDRIDNMPEIQVWRNSPELGDGWYLKSLVKGAL